MFHVEHSAEILTQSELFHVEQTKPGPNWAQVSIRST
jgi:hypothetical protein